MRFLLTACFALVARSTVFFQETFDASYGDRWVTSNWKQASGEAGKFIRSAGKFFGDGEDSQGLQTSQDARFYAASASFPEFTNKDKDLVVQFTVKHEQTIDCGGGYIKLFPAGLDQKELTGESVYNIMFGPDICGSTKKVHVIFNYKGDNKLIDKTIPAESDDLTHAYTLIVKPDNTFEVRIDGTKKEGGSLEDNWSFLPPRKIKDPAQSKPVDWVDQAQIDDPESVKPDGYDDIPAEIADPEAEKPGDWDDEDDGEWEAPTIPNPEYKGPWRAKKIPNPAYKGPWVHPEIDNPDFKDDKTIYAYPSFGAVGIDIWQVKSGTIFDNIFIGDNVAEAEAFFTAHNYKEAEQKARDARKAEETAAADAAAASATNDDTEDTPEGHDEL